MGSLQLLALILVAAGPGRSQSADVIRPDGQGDFRSVSVQGARGTYPQRFWLVVDRDPRGLLCRDISWRAWVALRYGAVIQHVPTDAGVSQPLISQGKPYLWVQAKPIDLLHDVRFRDRGQPVICAVRANSAFIAPIHPESLQESLQQLPIRP